jgi:hypothetical protein
MDIITTKEKVFPAGQTYIIFFAAFMLAIIFDYFFYGKALGVSFPLFVCLAFFSLFFLARKFKIRLKKTALLLAIPLFFFAFMVFFRESLLLTSLNVIASIGVSILIVQSIQGKNLINFFISDYIITIVRLPFRFLSQGVRMMQAFVRSIKPLRNKNTTIQVIAGIFMALPVLVLFAILFASADLVFRNLITRIFDIHINQSIFSQTLLVISATIIFFGAFCVAFKSAYELDVKISPEKQKVSTLGSVEMSVFLGCISLLFFLFISIQFAYFFGGARNIGAEGFTYAEYARKGFFELLAVSVISFFLVFFSEKAAYKKVDPHSLLFKAVSGIMVVEVLIIMASAFLRLVLYEEAFGFTELRLYSHIFTVWLACIFLALLYHIIVDRREDRFAFASFVLIITFLAFVNVLNPESFIARQNIARFNKTGKLDARYLTSLSSDAASENVKMLNMKLSSDDRNKLIDGIERMRARITDTDKDKWQSFHFSRAR